MQVYGGGSNTDVFYKNDLIDATSNGFAGSPRNTHRLFITDSTIPAGKLNSTYTFNDCVSLLTGGFTAFSVTGTEKWACTTFGRDPANASGTTAFESAEARRS